MKKEWEGKRCRETAKTWTHKFAVHRKTAEKQNQALALIFILFLKKLSSHITNVMFR